MVVPRRVGGRGLVRSRGTGDDTFLELLSQGGNPFGERVEKFLVVLTDFREGLKGLVDLSHYWDRAFRHPLGERYDHTLADLPSGTMHLFGELRSLRIVHEGFDLTEDGPLYDGIELLGYLLRVIFKLLVRSLLESLRDALPCCRCGTLYERVLHGLPSLGLRQGAHDESDRTVYREEDHHHNAHEPGSFDHFHSQGSPPDIPARG